MRVALALAVPFAFAAFALSACVASSPTPGPEARCADACRERAHACSAVECARGCRFVLDKLVEREGAHVIACVAVAGRRGCGDDVFADCAARSGPYLDGGPLPPKPPSDDPDDQP